MTEMDFEFLKVLNTIPKGKVVNSIYIAEQLGLPKGRVQSRVNLARLARLKRGGFVESQKEFLSDSKYWKLTNKGIDKIEENGREENAIEWNEMEEKRRQGNGREAKISK
jgi:hypothetical protein